MKKGEREREVGRGIKTAYSATLIKFYVAHAYNRFYFTMQSIITGVAIELPPNEAYSISFNFL